MGRRIELNRFIKAQATFRKRQWRLERLSRTNEIYFFFLTIVSLFCSMLFGVMLSKMGTFKFKKAALFMSTIILMEKETKTGSNFNFIRLKKRNSFLNLALFWFCRFNTMNWYSYLVCRFPNCNINYFLNLALCRIYVSIFGVTLHSVRARHYFSDGSSCVFFPFFFFSKKPGRFLKTNLDNEINVINESPLRNN